MSKLQIVEHDGAHYVTDPVKNVYYRVALVDGDLLVTPVDAQGGEIPTDVVPEGTAGTSLLATSLPLFRGFVQAPTVETGLKIAGLLGLDVSA